MPTETEWLAERRTGVTATDIAAISGMYRWRTPLQVYLDKIGDGQPVEMNTAMRAGQLMEPVIGTLYSEQTGHHVVDATPFTLVRHPDVAHHLATPDAHAYTSNMGPGVPGTDAIVDPSSMILLEKKAPGFRQIPRWGESGSQVMPPEYLIQCQWQMYVEGLSRCDLAALIGGQDLRIYQIEADEEVQGYLIDRADRFWGDHVLKGEPPPVDDTPEYEQYLRDKHPYSVESVVIADAVTEEAGQLYLVTKLEVAAAEQKLQFYRNQLINALEDSDELAGDQFRVTYRTSKASYRTDWRSFAHTLSGLLIDDFGMDEADVEMYADEHSELKPGTRRFLMKGPDND